MNLKTLNKDNHLIFNNENGKYDIEFNVGDQVQVAGLESLQNGILITILTGYQELLRTNNPTYSDYGNKSFQLLKANQDKVTEYKLEQYLFECLNKIRRIRSVDSLEISTNNYRYKCKVQVTSITDETVTTEVVI